MPQSRSVSHQKCILESSPVSLRQQNSFLPSDEPIVERFWAFVDQHSFGGRSADEVILLNSESNAWEQACLCLLRQREYHESAINGSLRSIYLNIYIMNTCNVQEPRSTVFSSRVNQDQGCDTQDLCVSSPGWSSNLLLHVIIGRWTSKYFTYTLCQLSTKRPEIIVNICYRRCNSLDGTQYIPHWCEYST